MNKKRVEGVYSHFVKRGAKYVTVSGEFASNCIAFKNPDGGYALVVANPYKDATTITFQGKSYKLPARSINTIYHN